MRPDRPAAQPVAVQKLGALAAIARVGDGRGHVEVVAPARELQAVKTPLSRLLRQLRQGQIRPLTGEQRDRTRHADLLSVVGPRLYHSRAAAGRAARMAT